MTDETNRLEPDLAFLRDLVDGNRASRAQYVMGEAFVAGGGLYALQCLVNWAMLIATPDAPGLAWLMVGALPSVLFIGFCIHLNRRHGTMLGASATARAINAMFQAVGYANVALICIFAPAAMMRQDFTIWMFYPAVVFALQGAAWLTAYLLRRRLWLLGVALGWFASAIALGLLIGTATYLLVAGLALLLFMALPGYAMMRLAKKQG